VRKMVNDAYLKALDMLTQNKDLLVKLAALLLQKEELYKDDLEQIMGKRSDPKEARKMIQPAVLGIAQENI